MENRINWLINYATKRRSVVYNIQDDCKRVVVHINTFTLITGFTLSLVTNPEYEEQLKRDENRKLVITPIKIRDGYTLTRDFETMFDYSKTYTLGRYTIIFNLMGNELINGNTLIINIPSDEFPETTEPIIWDRKYDNVDAYWASQLRFGDGYAKKEELLESLKLVITFNGTPVSI